MANPNTCTSPLTLPGGPVDSAQVRWPRPVQRRQVLGALALGGCFAPLGVGAQDSAPGAPAAPNEVRQHLGPAARQQGSARLRFLGLSVYTARLWVGAGFEPQRFDAHPLALELIYARSLTGSKIAERSIDEMRRGGSLEAKDEQRWLNFMLQAFPDVREADRLTGTWLPSERVSGFQVNGAAARTLRDTAFGPRFFGIWLAPHTSEPSLRLQLLGLGS